MRASLLFIVGISVLLLCSFSVEAGGGGGGGGGGGSGSSVPFLQPLLNVLLFIVISFFAWQKKK